MVTFSTHWAGSVSKLKRNNSLEQGIELGDLIGRSVTQNKNPTGLAAKVEKKVNGNRGFWGRIWDFFRKNFTGCFVINPCFKAD